MVVQFANEPLTDFTSEKNKNLMTSAISLVEQTFDKRYPLLINGKEVFTEKEIASLNPSDPSQVVGRVASADPSHVDTAIRSAYDAFKAWSRTTFDARARCLLRAASILRNRKFELSATMVLEVGKNWLEADADVAEAIDFCEFYAREAMRYGERQIVTPIQGEDSELFYLPIGVVVVIPPWNFPLAITTGMTVAALVTGNTVVLKPASPAPVIAYKLVEALLEAGFPPEVIQYCPGSGFAVGDTLVEHPLTRMIAFTGSKEVGLRIVEKASKTAKGQKWIKRVIAEMGGKDAIIVDETADLEQATQGIITSAFGYQGQKCSACSRLIVTEKVYDKIVDMVVEKAKGICVGPVKDPSNWMGPVVTESAMNNILSYIEVGKKEGRLAAGGFRLDMPGYFIAPTIFTDVQPGSRIEQEEIFGPVLACIRAKDFNHAIEIANDTDYGLTGAVYSRCRMNLELARTEFHVGNLYFNRKCTGALVGVHPFGGFNMSGTDSKAGGRDYLLLFLQAKSVSEKY